MTFLSRRKRQITRLASPAQWGARIISTILAFTSALSGASGQSFITPQNSQVVSPNFVPANPRPLPVVVPTTQVVPISNLPLNPGPIPVVVPSTQIVPVSYPVAQGKNGAQPKGSGVEETSDIYVRTELPGAQRLFMRESEAQFYDRIRQEAKKQKGAGPAIFPEETPVSKEKYVSPSYPRIDPLTRQAFAPHAFEVEPSYVCHRRLFFEQPNFERLAWNFGFLQPAMHVGTFYYDMAMGPYHFWSDFSNRGQCSVGKCLPGDQAPFTVPIERFSVTGVIGEAGVLIGGLYLFSHP